MAEDRVTFLRTVLHPALAVGVPFAFLQALDAVLRKGIVPGTAAGPIGTLAVVLLAGVSQVISSNILGRERITGALARVREIIVTMAGCLVLVMLLTGRPFHGDLGLLPDIAWPLVLCASQWLLTFSIQNMLRSRELFLRLVEGRTGNALVSAAHDASDEAGQAQAAFTRLRSSALLLQLFALVPWIIYQVVLSWSAASPPAPAVTVRMLINVVTGISFIAVLHGFADEHVVLASGISHGDAAASRRFSGPLVGIGVLFLAALALAGGRALLPLSLLAALAAWLSSLNKGVPSTGPAPSSLPQLPDASAAGPKGMELPPVQPSPLLEEIMRIIGIVLLAAAIVAFVIFVVRPLLRRNLLTSMRRFHPLRATIKAAAATLRFLAGLPGRFLRWARTPGQSLASITRAVIAGLRDSAGSAVREERARQALARVARSRAVREFRRLSRWGERSGVGLHDADGPMEYALRLLREVPAKEDAIREAARVFESLVFSRTPDPGDERVLVRLVNGIVR